MSDLGKRSSCLALVVAVLFAGCGPAVSQSRVAAFSEALGRTTTGVQTSFQVVEEAYFAAKLDGLVADYARNETPDPRVGRFLPAPDLADRLEVLRGFEAYAARLVEASGGKQFEALEQNTIELGQTLKGFKAGSFKVKDVLGDREIAGIETAIAAIGHFVIERKLARELPAIIREMHPHIEKAATLLVLDIGSPEDEVAPAGRRCTDLAVERNAKVSIDNLVLCRGGLRHQLKRDVTIRVEGRDLYIRQLVAQRHPSGEELRKEVAELVRLIQKAEAADAAMAITQATLRALVKAHAALEHAPDERNAAVDSMLRRFIHEAKRIEGIYGQALESLQRR